MSQSSSKAPAPFGTSTKRPDMSIPTDTPGPGAYTSAPAVTSGGADSRPSSAFKSSTKRGKDAELTFMGDPGSYDAHAQSEIGTLSKKSFGKSCQSGAGGFGSTAKARQELIQAGDGASPGPGSYNSTEPSKPEAKQGSSFASRSVRGQYSKSSDAPGVGSYEPILQQPAVLGGQSAFKSGGQRFKQDAALEAQSHIGPGSYSYSNNTIDAGMSQSSSKAPAPFGTSTKRPDMSIPTDTPGPGAYTSAPAVTSGGADSRPSSAFKSSTKRGKDAKLTFMGDPGSYDAHAQSEIGTLSKKSFGKSCQP